MIRKDKSDLVFLSEQDKFQAILEISRLREARPTVLVGTTSIETSERLAKLLQGASIPHEVLMPSSMSVRRTSSPSRPSRRDHDATTWRRGTDIVLAAVRRRKSMPSKIPTSGAEANSRRLANGMTSGGLRRPAYRRYRTP